MSQGAYIDQLVLHAEMKDCRMLEIPMDTHVHLSTKPPTSDKQDAMRSRPYSALVGLLLYAAVGTRPDIAFVTSQLACVLSCPTPAHWNAARCVIRYLKGTRNVRLTFSAANHSGLKAYTNADWAGQEDRHSISGAVFMYSGAAISWSSKRQSLIALSSTEAEYIAATDACRKLSWLQSLIQELTNHKLPSTITCYEYTSLYYFIYDFSTFF
jgi:hypothetical protein